MDAHAWDEETAFGAAYTGNLQLLQWIIREEVSVEHTDVRCCFVGWTAATTTTRCFSCVTTPANDNRSQTITGVGYRPCRKSSESSTTTCVSFDMRVKCQVEVEEPPGDNGRC